jgi:DNA-binding NarL/FixJ family response regulator
MTVLWPAPKPAPWAWSAAGSAVETATLRTIDGAVETCSAIVAVPQAAETIAAPIRAILKRTMLFSVFNVRIRRKLPLQHLSTDLRVGVVPVVNLTIYFAPPGEGAAMFSASGLGEQQGGGDPLGDEPIRVLIVEDHRVVAEGLAALINHQGDMKVVGEASSVAESITAATEIGPDVVLLDFRLPDGTGADAAAAIRAIRPEAKMIFLTREDSDAARFAAVQSGASAFIHKSKAASEVVTAIRDVARGRMLITPRTIATLLAKRKAADVQLESLTVREKEVLRLMAEGLPSRGVAVRLGISYTTVRTHIRSLGSKLGVHSKLEAIVKARELGLIN